MVTRVLFDGSLRTCGAAVCSATTEDPSEPGPHQVSRTGKCESWSMAEQ